MPRSEGLAAGNWSERVTTRLEALPRLHGKRLDGPDFRDGRVSRFSLPADEKQEPCLSGVHAELDPQTTVLDVGAGAGRFAIPLARHAKQVEAVDPNPAML